MLKRINIQLLGNLLVIFYFFLWIFPSLRLALVGPGEMKSAFDVLVTVSPDLFFMLVLAIAFLFYMNKRNSGTSFSFSFTDKAFVVFWFTNVIVGFLLSMDLKISLYGFRITYLPMTFYLVGKLFSLVRKEEMEKVLYRIMMVNAFFALTGIVIYFGFPELGASISTLTGYQQGQYFIPRMTSILWTPVLFATMMGISALYFLFRIFKDGKRSDHIFFSLFWLCLFMSVSRGPILGFLIGFIFLAIVFRNMKKALVAFGLMAGVTGVIGIIVPESAKAVLWIFQSAGQTMSMGEGISRVKLWKISFEDLKARPYGYGLGKAGATAYRFLKDRPVPCAPYSTDGWYLKIACETGIYGLLSYLVFCFIYLRNGMRAVKKKDLLIPLALAAFLMINAQNVPCNTLDFYPEISFYWLLLGFAAGQLNNTPDEQR